MTSRKKPRNKGEKVTSKAVYPIEDITSVTDPKMPKFYMAVQGQNIENLPQIKERLLKRGIKVVEPITIIRLTRLMPSVELLIALEKVSE